MGYDDEPNEDEPLPNDVVLPDLKSGILEVKITGYSVEAIQQRAAEILAGRAEELLKKTIEERVEAAIAEVSEQAIRDRIAPEIDASLAKGWQRTDSYGRPQGPPETLSDRIREFLNRQDEYHPRGRWWEKRVQAAVDEAFKKDLAQELQAAKTAFRGLVDTRLMQALKGSLSEALGLKL